MNEIVRSIHTALGFDDVQPAIDHLRSTINASPDRLTDKEIQAIKKGVTHTFFFILKFINF